MTSSSSLSADDNKICQWYCCSCGQSYGSVIYKNKIDDPEIRDIEDPTTTTTTASSQFKLLHHHHHHQHLHQPHLLRESASTNDVIENLRYYSQVVYRDHIPPRTLFESSNSTNGDQQYPTLSSTLQQHQQQLHEEKLRRQPIKSVSDISDCRHPTPILGGYPMVANHSGSTQALSPINLDGNSYQDDNVIVNIPNRFTCHRCDHMMCPYCPKLRLRDLR